MNQARSRDLCCASIFPLSGDLVLQGRFLPTAFSEELPPASADGKA